MNFFSDFSQNHPEPIPEVVRLDGTVMIEIEGAF